MKENRFYRLVLRGRLNDSHPACLWREDIARKKAGKKRIITTHVEEKACSADAGNKKWRPVIGKNML